MQALYVGDARNAKKRILTNHIGGNVESSVLRKYVAQMLGLKIKSELRSHSSYRIRIDSSDISGGENTVSDYIKRGSWRVILLGGYEQAHELQWYVINELCPPLNRQTMPSGRSGGIDHGAEYKRLMVSPLLGLEDIFKLREGPGLYVFYNTPITCWDII